MSDKPVAAGKSSFDLLDIEKTIALIDIQTHSNFIDLACGTGRYSLEIAKFIGSKGMVYAVDLWQEGIEILNQEILKKNIDNIQTTVADISKKLPFDSHSIDSSLMATVVHDLPADGQKSSIKEVSRLLKPGGLLNIIEFKKIEKGPGPPVHIRMGEEEIELLVKPFGFQEVKRGEVGKFNYLVQYKKI